MRRLVLLTGVFLLSTSLPASANMPPFDMEVETRGDTVHVTVTIIGDESLIHDVDSPLLNGLLAVFPAGQVEASRPHRSETHPRRLRPGHDRGRPLRRRTPRAPLPPPSRSRPGQGSQSLTRESLRPTRS